MSFTGSAVFSSAREKHLWTWAAIAVAGIYATLGLARTLTDELGPDLISALFWIGLFMIAASVLFQAVRGGSGRAEIGVLVGVGAVYLMLFTRMGVAAERSHLIEYSVVALLIHEALLERRAQGHRLPLPGLLAIAATALIGALDEAIQLAMPSRVFDPVDILFNLLAAVMAVAAGRTLRWARRRTGPISPTASSDR